MLQVNQNTNQTSSPGSLRKIARQSAILGAKNCLGLVVNATRRQSRDCEKVRSTTTTAAWRMKQSFPIFDGMNYFTLNRLSLPSHEVPKQCFFDVFHVKFDELSIQTDDFWRTFEENCAASAKNSDFEAVFADETWFWRTFKTKKYCEARDVAREVPRRPSGGTGCSQGAMFFFRRSGEFGALSTLSPLQRPRHAFRGILSPPSVTPCHHFRGDLTPCMTL